MEDVRDLKELQLDALREVANIGAGHAATALSQMTNRTIMITVPEVNVRAAGGGGRHRRARPTRSIAAVLMHMMGDLTGRTLVLFPEGSARTLCDILLRASAGHHRRNSARWSSPGSRRPATSSPAPTSTRSATSWG